MSYQVVQDESIDELMERVNRLLRDGWVVAGGIAAAVCHFKNRDDRLDSAIVYLQALVRQTP